MAFDPDLATKAWMATLDGAVRAKSDAYFEGGYWLILWGFLAGVAADLAILRFGRAQRLSARVQTITPRKGLQSFLFAIPYLLLGSLLVLPLTLYQDFFPRKAVRPAQPGFRRMGRQSGNGAGHQRAGLRAVLHGRPRRDPPLP
jgi:STE24 endopeptidase